MHTTPAVLILGLGNNLRGDDGVGHWICHQLQHEDLPGVTVETAMQLYPEHLHQFLDYDAILVVDASVAAAALQIVRIENLSPGTASSHHQDLPTMAALGLQLFNRQIALYACHIPAEQFDIGQAFSASCSQYAQLALPLIRSWIAAQQNPA